MSKGDSGELRLPLWVGVSPPFWKPVLNLILSLVGSTDQGLMPLFYC